MKALINNFRLGGGICGAVAVTGLAAGALLYFCGHGPQQQRAVARATSESSASSATDLQQTIAALGSVAAGERQYLQTCAACHGPGGLGQPHMGADLRDSRFIREQSDDALVEFVKTGRPFGDPKSVLGLSMPAKGGNPTLQDGQIRDIVAFLRTVQAKAAAQGAEAGLN